jgi:hypothetical protein
MSDAFKFELDALAAQLDAPAATQSAARLVATALAAPFVALPRADVPRADLPPALLARLRAPRKRAAVFRFWPPARLVVLDVAANGVVRLVFTMPREQSPTRLTHLSRF